ncbi:MAG: peptidoglycan-associated lipoprotein [Desulfuromonas sp.]|nr:MAG: peptidoglycan-associated lipoprotein [Desulfuromonas sp.]
MKKINVMRFVLIVALASLLATGCAMTPAQQEQDTTTSSQQTQSTDTNTGAVTEEKVVEEVTYTVSDLTRVHFDFDSYVLKPKARRTLAQNAEVLKALSGLKVRIEGHCDERGSDEYNLALGERRAQAAMNYMATLGVPASRMSTISYGEEKPLDPGHDEEAWAKNRRAEFVAN